MATSRSDSVPPEERATWDEIMVNAIDIFNPQKGPPERDEVDFIINLLSDLPPDECRYPPEWVDTAWLSKNISTFAPDLLAPEAATASSSGLLSNLLRRLHRAYI